MVLRRERSFLWILGSMQKIGLLRIARPKSYEPQVLEPRTKRNVPVSEADRLHVTGVQ